ncbi:hypothetical protein HDG34_003363 [Paraburkholderia sp. HC6.4b]|uniref:hypothetical protein n=1 Tax=unclassified Paraburkholderia TaxID=2615204 RepID=UPI001622BFD2|nr:MULTISPECIES: hypothetical protein [unclassified Paraburkholderia]MBB5409422.1 hypothetical protein [Paraburkholderia sp. HC6.4b]MBB5451152.1 hypothetical protein [Paraburkholderia sp. Kb1A]
MNDTMEVKKVRVPNEFLVRFDVRGVPIGAHLVMMSYLQAGEEILEETIRLEDAVPTEWSSVAIASLLGDYAAQLSAELSAKQRELDQARAWIAQFKGGAPQPE